jgi:hypothetical protein
MKIELTLACSDEELVREFLATQSSNKLVQFRASSNLALNKKPVTEDRFWRALICLRMTSRQKSGPGSPVMRFISQADFPLSLKTMRENANPERFIAETLEGAGACATTKLPQLSSTQILNG